MYLSVEEQEFLIRVFAKQLDLKIYIRKKLPIDCLGFHINHTNEIWISKSSPSLLAVFFHELGHHYACSKNLFKIFHRKHIPKSRQEFLAWTRTARRAEIWVDKWGERLFYEMFPDLFYYTCYRKAYPGDKRPVEGLIEQGEEIRRSMRHRPPQTRSYRQLIRQRNRTKELKKRLQEQRYNDL